MRIACTCLQIAIALFATITFADEPLIVVAEGERFQTSGEDGWRVLPERAGFERDEFRARPLASE